MSQPATTPQAQLSTYEKVDVFFAVLSIIGTVVYTAVTAPFRGTSGADSYIKHFTHSVVRKLITRLSTAQLQYVLPTFDLAYHVWSRTEGVRAETIKLKSGCNAHWIGSKDAKYVVVYFHGGGWSMDGGAEHFNFWNEVRNDVKANGISISFLFLEYTLVPHGTYPTQLREAVEAIQYVTNNLNRSTSEVILAGDSAGANMCIAMLSHMMHPSPDLPGLQIDRPLKAIILVSPLVTFNMDYTSTKRNAYKDIITGEAVDKWTKDYLAGKKTTFYTEPLNAPKDWWKGAKVEQILTVAGQDEILLDSISEWVENYESGNNNMTYVIGKGEAHNAPIFEPHFGQVSSTQQGEAIKAFLKSRL